MVRNSEFLLSKGLHLPPPAKEHVVALCFVNAKVKTVSQGAAAYSLNILGRLEVKNFVFI